ncbi:MAG: prepilin-type N-terminal cleavage/methylation domain-containing protein, partial [Bdellovibrionota bacterium]
MRRNQKGYSLVEAIIALGIAGIVAVSVMSAFPYLRKLNNRARGGGACRAYIDAAFGKLEQEGFRGNYDMTIPTTTTNVPNSLAWGSVPMQPWGAAGLPLIGFTNSDEFTQLRTPGLITSSVTLVNALYRSQSTICSTTYQIVGSASALPAFLPQPPVEMHDPGNVSLHGFRVRMSVKPFDLNRS